ncbi:autotransporter outer membrane beta-barrel domain-containing protein [Pseudomonas fluorescens]|uniref:Autotransporter domain-containing protein n=1 Tax=Pseudomonas fluorescens TaxID=294 RepID=A0A5E7FX51_PSEFL|nr:autotransporter outer membrane beta-barrel domain-containing protein [Pseudomonas fluorescens]VVO42867.1 hypothetical protein PS723_06077 [Pseudomonas fluorescens]
MSVTPLFSLKPLTCALKLAVIASSWTVSQQALALTQVDGTHLTINGSTPSDSYEVTNDGALTANGAKTRWIMATDSTLNLTATEVNATGKDGVRLLDSDAFIVNSEVNSDGIGLSLWHTHAGKGSRAQVTGSTITGADVGVTIGEKSTLMLESTTVSATHTTGVGVLAYGANITASNSTIIGGLNGVNLYADLELPASNALVLDKTRVEGLSGSAIVVDGSSQTNDEKININVNNGSTLVGGNGTMLEVINGASARFKADNSELTGDIIVEAGSSANVTLENFAVLTGRLENLTSLAVNSDAKWVMVGNGDIADLSMNGGKIQFGSPTDFYKLTVGNLSGNGTFIMDADFTTGQVDTLEVTGKATGNHHVLMGSSGADPTGAGSIPVIRIAEGDASFALLNGPVDLGAYSYDLIKQGDNAWHLNTATRVISPGTRSVLALFNTAPTVWYGELSTLRSRMGEVRMNEGKAGGWVRTYGNKFDVSASSGLAYQQTQQGLSFGADAPLPIGNGQWLAGLLGGYSKSDLNLSHGTSGTVNSYYVGAYTTWLDEQSGYYFDGVLKFNRFQNKSRVQLSDGKQTKGNYDNNGVGASLEFGRHIKLDDGYFVEPFTQLAGVIVQGKGYDLDNGLSAEGDRTRSLLGKLGATAGREFDLGEGQVVQPYVRAAYVHEFAKNNTVRVNNNAFNNDLSGSRGELGAGVAVKLSDKVSAHVDLDYSNSEKIDQPWGANIGLHYSF